MPDDETYDHSGAEELHALGSSWGDMSEDLRRRWCFTQLSFPPVWLGTVFMVGTSQALRARRYSTISWWVGVAREFDAVGFSPEMYYILRLCISSHLVEGQRHPLIHVSNINAPRDFIRAAEWVGWLELVREGRTPLNATSVVMDAAGG